MRGLRLHRYCLGHQRQQGAGVGPFGIVALEIHIDEAKQGFQARLALGSPVFDHAHESGIHVAGQSPQQSGFAAEVMRRQATAVTGLLAHLAQGDADPTLARDDLPGGLEHALFGFGASFQLGATRARRRVLGGGVHRRLISYR
ncbi:hypothetical protein D9M68_805070 [compost metagenome]